MATHISTTNPVRSDVVTNTAPRVRRPRRWALAGLAAAVAGLGAAAASFQVDAVYQGDLDAQQIADRLHDQVGLMLAFHVLQTLAALLLVVFALGLHRRLRASTPADSLAPGVAAAGLLGTAVVLVMSTALDTEFIFALGEPDRGVPEAAVVYNHWIGTTPLVWVLGGLTGLALFACARAGATPRWLGWVGLVLGGLVVLLGVSPLQYMAAFAALPMLLVVSLGFLVGDRR